MTGKKNEARDALNRLADALVDDVLGASDQEILTEFREAGSDPEKLAGDMRALFERSVLAANKSKLAAAKAGAARAKATPVHTAAPIDIAAARKRLHEILQTPSTLEKLTMAARKESELSDADVIGMLGDLRALGIIDDGDTGGGNA
jgi:hypothetical protein